MPARRINPTWGTPQHSYTVNEVADRLGAHENTVRPWQRDGLVPLDRTRPMLFPGATLRTFLSPRQAQRRTPCGPGRSYCVRCRKARPLAEGMVDLRPLTARAGNLRALCGTCGALMHRRASLTTLGTVMPGIAVQIAQAP